MTDSVRCLNPNGICLPNSKCPVCYPKGDIMPTNLNTLAVERSDLDKLFDVLERAYQFHVHRDIMNAQTHLAKETRNSPLTSELSASLDRLKRVLS